jgi:hypothetical protein
MLRLARRRQSAQDEQVALRVGGTAANVRASLRRLRAQGFVEIPFDGPARLTMAGLAVAVALLPTAAPKRVRTSARTSRAA